jgi:ankyrin repeat protein
MSEVELAAHFNFQGILEEMLEIGDVSPAKKTKALLWACRRGHAEIVSILLRAGADPREPLLQGQNALTIAAEAGQYDCLVTVLNDPSIDPNAEGRRGRSALSFAAANGFIEIVRLGTDSHQSRLRR